MLLFPCTRELVALNPSAPVLVAQTPAAGLVPDFGHIDSSKLQVVEGAGRLMNRADFLALNRVGKPPVIGKSGFVSRAMVEHLMRHKKDRAIGVKYESGDGIANPGDEITNMEGAMHTFVTPVCEMLMTGDYHWVGRLQGSSFGQNRVRPVILSASINPDFEFDNVILPLVRVLSQSVEGSPPREGAIPTAAEKRSDALRQQYDEGLRRQMIHALSPDHRIPALGEIPADHILGSTADAREYLEGWIKTRELPNRALQGRYFRTPHGDVISLEILFQIYVEQIANEFKVLNPRASQGYIHTISPPTIFCRYLGDASIMNRLQALAFKWLHQQGQGLFSNMKMLAFSDYADPEMIFFFQQALPTVRVIRREELFPYGHYAGPPGLALVLHNNSDGFGQNIETEGPTSTDGVIGCFSDAAVHLDRSRPDLLDYIF